MHIRKQDHFDAIVVGGFLTQDGADPAHQSLVFTV